MNSDEIVESLKPFGRVRTHQHTNGSWTATCELFIKGLSAEVKSGYDHPTMRSALIALQAATFKCVSEMQASLKALPSIGGNNG